MRNNIKYRNAHDRYRKKNMTIDPASRPSAKVRAGGLPIGPQGESGSNYEHGGKVQLQIAHRTIACVAYSGEVHRFEKGDPVVVVGMKAGKVWVIPAADLSMSSN